MQELLWFSKFWKDFIGFNLYYALLIWINQLRMNQKTYDLQFEEDNIFSWSCCLAGVFEIQDELFDRYADIAYLLLFPHLNKYLQIILFFTLLIPVNLAVFVYYFTYFLRDRQHQGENLPIDPWHKQLYSIIMLYFGQVYSVGAALDVGQTDTHNHIYIKQHMILTYTYGFALFENFL